MCETECCHCQVSCKRVRRRHVLLLCRNVVCCRRHPRSLQQDDAALLHPTSLQLRVLSSAALSPRALSQTPTTKVCHQLTSSSSLEKLGSGNNVRKYQVIFQKIG